MGTMVKLKRPDGKTTDAWWVEVAGAKAAVVVIQEWWGLNAQIRRIADYFAAAGFSALAPDLYHGRLAANVDEAKHLMDGLDFADAVFQDMTAALTFLGGQHRRVGMTGFCMGGALTVAAAVHLQPQLASASCFYGLPPAAFADPALIRIPFQGHFATKDAWITPEKVDQLEAVMREAGQVPELYRYPADHAFVNQLRPEVYDASCAEQALERTVGFFQRTLSEE